MAKQAATSPKSPARAAVRGFLNLSAALPDFNAKPIGAGVGLGGPTGCKGLHYGEGNTVPVVALAAAHASGTAYRCLERRAQLLEGLGFAGTQGDTPLPGHATRTANDLWAMLCSYAAYNNGAAVLVRYRGVEGDYAIGEVHVLPFGAVRKTVNGTYLLNHKFGRKGFSASDTTEHLPFNPDRKQVKREMTAGRKLAAEKNKPYVQAGQILYIYNPKAGEEDYPLPPHWAGLEALLTEAAYESYDLSEVRRGFRAKGMLAMLGKTDDAQKDEHGKTQKDYQDEALRRFTVAGAEEQGVERDDVLVIDVTNKDEVPVWVGMSTTTDLKWLSEKKESVGQEICRHIGIPPVLLGFAKPGQLGNNTELLNTYQLTQDSLEPLRRCLLRAFWQLMPTLNGIVPGLRTPQLTTPTTPAAGAATPANA